MLFDGRIGLHFILIRTSISFMEFSAAVQILHSQKIRPQHSNKREYFMQGKNILNFKCELSLI